MEKLKNSGVIDELHVTDSHPRALEVQGDFVKIHSTGPLFAEYITAMEELW